MGMKREVADTLFEIVSEDDSSHGVEREDDSQSGLEMSQTRNIDGTVIGVLAGLKDSGEPLVNFPSNTSGNSLEARTTIALSKSNVGREVVLTFENGNPLCPIVLGLIQGRVSEYNPPETVGSEKQSFIELELDGERLVFTAKKEIVLRCGNASITLTRAGKVLIRGAYLLSRSSGVNRIKGGSVQIN